jgi:transposase-like protein
VLVAIGIKSSGHRTVLGVSVSLSEAEMYWFEFLCSVKQRGMHDAKLIVSEGLRKTECDT